MKIKFLKPGSIDTSELQLMIVGVSTVCLLSAILVAFVTWSLPNVGVRLIGLSSVILFLSRIDYKRSSIFKGEDE